MWSSWQHNSNGTRIDRTLKVTVPDSPDEHLVTTLPLLDPEAFSTQHWAGLLPASSKGDKYFFYWLFEAERPSHHADAVSLQDAPLLIWLNGGPGCSSMDGLFLENGPFRFVMDDGGLWTLQAAPFSWHKAPAYTLYIDQPVGTGLSFTTAPRHTGYPTNDHQVNVDFYFFLQQFLRLHADKFVEATPRKQLNRHFYMSGESHAGHYIPHMMSYILTMNEKLDENNQGDVYISLSGAAIGNGWVDPFYQYASAKAAYGKGILGHAQVLAQDEKERQCQDALNSKDYTADICFDLLDDVIKESYGHKNSFGVSQYDARKSERKGTGAARNFPPGHKIVETYLGAHSLKMGSMPEGITNSVLEAIHATPSQVAGQRYAECTNPPYDALAHQDGKGVVPDVIQLLHHDKNTIRLLFFNGIEDLICNHVGNEIWMEQMPWDYQQEWMLAERAAWYAESQQLSSSLASKENRHPIAGYVKQFRNLYFLKLLNSGHMVPMDLPDVSLDMMRAFMFGGESAFSDSPQRLPRVDDSSNDDNAHCPTCRSCDDFVSSAVVAVDPNNNSSIGKISAILLLAGTLLIVMVGYLRRKNRFFRRGTNRALDSYDMEMRDGSYFDNPAANPEMFSDADTPTVS